MIDPGVRHAERLSRFTIAQVDALAIAPWLLIPYDSLTHLAGLDPGETAQSLPATAVFCVAYLVLRGSSLRTCERSRLVCLTMAKAVAVMFVVTLLNIALEQSGIVRADLIALRLPTAARQSVSMLLGLGTFLMFQDSLLRTGFAVAMRWILIGCVPSLILLAVQIVTGEFRVQGFSSEPSLVADMLVLAFLPACATAAMSVRIRWVGALFGTAALLRTFSTTGFMKAFFAAVVYFIERRQLARGVLILGLFLGVVYIVFSSFPENYAALVFSYMNQQYERTGELVTGSFIDRFYGFAGPFSLMSSPHGWLGFGFGGDTVYFDTMFQGDIAAAIRNEKPGMVSISSLQGKMLMYGGVLGYALYCTAWLRAWKGAPRLHLARVMLPAIFLSSLFSLGPMFLPYTWLWLAIASTAALQPWRDAAGEK